MEARGAALGAGRLAQGLPFDQLGVDGLHEIGVLLFDLLPGLFAGLSLAGQGCQFVVGQLFGLGGQKLGTGAAHSQLLLLAVGRKGEDILCGFTNLIGVYRTQVLGKRVHLIEAYNLSVTNASQGLLQCLDIAQYDFPCGNLREIKPSYAQYLIFDLRRIPNVVLM